MEHVTKRDIENLIVRLNRVTGNPEECMTEGKANVGHYHLDQAYRRYRLVQTTSPEGDIRCAIDTGYQDIKTIYHQARAYLAGILQTRPDTLVGRELYASVEQVLNDAEK